MCTVALRGSAGCGKDFGAGFKVTGGAALLYARRLLIDQGSFKKKALKLGSIP
jgi:hypothetical protein